jgi:quinolinate synthase
VTILEAHYDPALAAEIRDLAAAKNAVILAHNYERPEIQDVADYVGDSLGLSREAARTDADVIVFCGVHFMAETAAILSPQKTVLLPDLAAGCSLASTIDADQLRAWKAEHPGAVVVAYVNTTAEVKAESDYCCTSGNAVEVVNAIPADKEILFLPDMFLGAHVRRETGRQNIHVWMGECHVHAGIDPEHISRTRAQHPGAEFLIHPECGCATPVVEAISAGAVDPRQRAHPLHRGDDQTAGADRAGHVHRGHGNRHPAPPAAGESHQALHRRQRSRAVLVHEGHHPSQGA